MSYKGSECTTTGVLGVPYRLKLRCTVSGSRIAIGFMYGSSIYLSVSSGDLVIGVMQPSAQSVVRPPAKDISYR